MGRKEAGGGYVKWDASVVGVAAAKARDPHKSEHTQGSPGASARQDDAPSSPFFAISGAHYVERR